MSRRLAEDQQAFGINDFGKMIEFLVEDKSIPHELKQYFWAFADKEMTLTNLKSKDIDHLMMMYDTVNLSALMTMPSNKYTFMGQTDHLNLRTKTFIKLKRSEDGFERKIQATQIREIRTDSGQKADKRGFVSRIFGLGRK